MWICSKCGHRTEHEHLSYCGACGTKRADGQPYENMSQRQPGSRLFFLPGAQAKVRYVPSNVKRVLQGIDGQRTVEEVVAQSGIDPAQATQIIHELLKHHILEADPPLPTFSSPQCCPKCKNVVPAGNKACPFCSAQLPMQLKTGCTSVFVLLCSLLGLLILILHGLV